MKIVLVGAGSREFGPASIRDLLLSDALCDSGLDIVLMDLDAAELSKDAGATPSRSRSAWAAPPRVSVDHPPRGRAPQAPTRS